MPAAVEAMPPDSIPMGPSSLMASITPLAIQYPNPERGTVAPDPANFTIGSYIPKAVKTTPAITYETSIRAGVNLVLSIKICAITHKSPPTQNAFKYSNLIHPFHNKILFPEIFSLLVILVVFVDLFWKKG